jgi:hypothetical protein
VKPEQAQELWQVYQDVKRLFLEVWPTAAPTPSTTCGASSPWA